MKKITSILLLTLAVTCFSIKVVAQEGYTYTLLDNGSYNYTIAAVPNASTSNFNTSVQSYGFTILVPDGVTITIESSFGSSAGATNFSGSDVGMPTIDGYLITEVLGSPLSLPAPSSGTVSPMVTIQVIGSPTTGEISLLANNSSLATTITALKSFMSADMIDDGTFLFPPVVDAFASALSGTTSYSFDTLDLKDNALNNLHIYPNPVKHSVNIVGLDEQLKTIEVYNINGQLVLQQGSNLGEINLSAFEAGVYFLKLSTDVKEKTFKLVKE